MILCCYAENSWRKAESKKQQTEEKNYPSKYWVSEKPQKIWRVIQYLNRQYKEIKDSNQIEKKLASVKKINKNQKQKYFTQK